MRKYDNEFKQMAVKKILDGQSVASVSRELGVAEGVLHNWKKLKLETSSNVEQELIELKKKLREVEMERDILKKAALIFGRGSSHALSLSSRKVKLIQSKFCVG
jgi:transposase